MWGSPLKVFSLLIQEEKEFLTNHIKKAKLYGYAENTLRYEPSFDDESQYQMTTVYDSETQMFLIRINDWTEKMAIEKRLAHSGSLSTIGELAASIAHEIKNPMTTLKGFVQLFKISTSDETMKYLAVIDDEIYRMESILSEMLVLSKPSSNKKTTFSLEVLVDDMLQVATESLDGRDYDYP